MLYLAQKKFFVLFLLLTSSFPASIEKENSKKLCYKRTVCKGLSFKFTLTAKLTATFLITLNFTSFLLILINLLRSGDIATNPGPVLSQTQTQNILQKAQKKLKLLCLNCQSISKKTFHLKQMISTYTNCIFCFTETWLTKFEEENFCNPLIDDYVCLRNDRLASMSDNKKRAEELWH